MSYAEWCHPPGPSFRTTKSLAGADEQGAREAELKACFYQGHTGCSREPSCCRTGSAPVLGDAATGDNLDDDLRWAPSSALHPPPIAVELAEELKAQNSKKVPGLGRRSSAVVTVADAGADTDEAVSRAVDWCEENGASSVGDIAGDSTLLATFVARSTWSRGRASWTSF